jgi:hypothetical protein
MEPASRLPDLARKSLLEFEDSVFMVFGVITFR